MFNFLKKKAPSIDLGTEWEKTKQAGNKSLTVNVNGQTYEIKEYTGLLMSQGDKMYYLFDNTGKALCCTKNSPSDFNNILG